MTTKPAVSETDVGTYIAVWLDVNVNKSEQNLKAQSQIRLFLNCLVTFDNVNECEKYIRSVSSQKQIILIISGRFGREFVPMVHALPNIVRIYVYCGDKQGNEKWSKNFSKVKYIN